VGTDNHNDTPQSQYIVNPGHVGVWPGPVKGWLWGPARAGVSVCLRLEPPASAPSSLFQADVRDEEALYRTFDGVGCVFHVASYGMSGVEKVRPLHMHLELEWGLNSCSANHVGEGAWGLFNYILYLHKEIVQKNEVTSYVDNRTISKVQNSVWYPPLCFKKC
jgi:hypothetical protein